MLRATLVSKLEAEKGRGSATLSVNADVGDAKLKGSVVDALAQAPSFTFSLEKPGSFSIDYSPVKVINGIVTTSIDFPLAGSVIDMRRRWLR